MRPLWLAIVALTLPGCLGGVADDTTPASTTNDLAETSPTFPLELGSMDFSLGPAGNTAVTKTSVSLVDLVVPEGATGLIVKLTIEQGASVNFHVTGLEGCEIDAAGPRHLSGMEVSPECAANPGTYTLTAAHDSGSVIGHVAVIAV